MAFGGQLGASAGGRGRAEGPGGRGGDVGHGAGWRGRASACRRVGGRPAAACGSNSGLLSGKSLRFLKGRQGKTFG